jgi:hypothetical protein
LFFLALVHAFNDDFFVHSFSKNPLNAVFQSDHCVRAAATGTHESDIDVGSQYRDHFQIAAVGLQCATQFFQYFTNLSIEFHVFFSCVFSTPPLPLWQWGDELGGEPLVDP